MLNQRICLILVTTIVFVPVTTSQSEDPKNKTALVPDAGFLLEQAAESAKQISYVSFRVGQLSRIALLQTEIGDLDRAVATVDAIEKILGSERPILQDLNDAMESIVKALARKQDAVTLIRIARFKFLDKCVDTGDLLKEAAIILADMGDEKRALQVIEAIDETNCGTQKNEALQYLAKQQWKAGDAKEADRTLSLITGKYRENYQSDVLREIVALDAASRNFDRALETAEKIVVKGDKASALSAIAAAQWKAGNKKTARRSLQQAFQLARKEEDYYDRIDPLKDIIKTRTLFGIHEFDDILAAVDPQRKVVVNSLDVLLAVGMAQAELGDKADSSKSFQAVAEFVAKSGDEKFGGLKWVSTARAKAGDVQGAIQTIRLQDNHDLEDMITSDVVHEMIWLNRFSEAISLARSIHDKSRREGELYFNYEMQIEAGNINEAVQNMNMLFEGAPGNPEFLLKVANAYAGKGDQKKAREVVQQAIGYAKQIDNDSYYDFWYELLEAQRKYEGPDAAKATMPHALKVMNRIKEPLFLTKFQARVARFQSSVGLRSESEETFRLAVKTAVEIKNDEIERSLAFEDIAEARATLGQLDVVQKWADSLINLPFDRSSVLYGAARGLAQTK